MTPDAYEYGWIGDDYMYELSEGKGLVGEPIFGVSVRLISGGRDEFSRDQSDLVMSRKAAREWIETAREELDDLEKLVD
jgi:hypothetical protein